MEEYSHINKDKLYVKSLQQKVGAKEDGVYGPNTHKLVREYFGSPVIMHMGKVVPIKSSLEIDWSASLYELDDGTKNWYERNNDPETICVHWGGLNSRHCYNVFNMAKGRHVSSHFLIGKNHKTNKYEILQCLDTGLVAYHAGKFNKKSIGIDICMHPDPKFFNKTKTWYPGAEIQKITTSDKRVQNKEVVMIDKEFANICKEFLKALRESVNLSDKPVCEKFDVMSVAEASKYSIVGHHNISEKKWDVIPWADKLYYNL